MLNRIDLKFRKLKKENKKALIVYLTCGYPNLSTTEKLALELDRQGVDIIELGVPFSDPLADGPVIQEASHYALGRNKINLAKIFSLVKRLRRKTQIPICLMGYYNPIFSYGEERFVADSVQNGVDGVIIPDLPPEEAGGLIAAANKNNFSTIFLLSPTSSPRRVKLISQKSKGFIYYVSLAGVTGARKNLPADLADKVRSIKRQTKKPACVGFGISSREHVKQVSNIADGAIIGSAVIKLIRENIGKKDLVAKVGRFVATLQTKKPEKKKKAVIARNPCLVCQ